MKYMEQEPLVSIIIPVYNVEQYIDQCIGSVLNQTYKNLDIIMVDDGSPDNCPTICDNYAKKDNRITVLHKKNGGLSDARNYGLKLVKGDFVFFLDSDDFIHEKTIEYLVGLSFKYDADLIQAGRELGQSSSFEKICFEKKDKVFVFDNISIFESSLNNVSLCMKLYKTSLWNGIEMPVGKLNEDDYTTWKLYYRAKTIVVSSYCLYYNRINPTGIISSLKKNPDIKYPMEAYHERIDFFDSIGDEYLSDLSKWRYSKYLMRSFCNPRLTKEQFDILTKEFHKIYKSVLFCRPVPFIQKILIMICYLSPKTGSNIIRLMRRK